MGNKATISAVLWAANVVVWGYVFILDRNLQSETRRRARLSAGEISVDLTGDEPVAVDYNKKMIPEFSIYQF